MGFKEEYHRRQAAKHRAEEDKKALKGFGRKSFRHPDPMVRFTFAVAIFTLILAFVGAIQLWTYIAGERAYLTLADIAFDPKTVKIGEPIVATIQIKNGGHLAAIITDSNLTVRLESDLPSLPVYDPMSVQLAAPIEGGGIEALGFTTRRGLTKEGETNFAEGKAKYYLYGYISFTDSFSFGTPKIIGFCYVYRATTIAGRGPFDGCVQPNYTYYRE